MHGKISKYEKLFNVIKNEKPDAVFMGGDLFPSHIYAKNNYNDFIKDFLAKEFESLQKSLGSEYPDVFLILGNDDSRSQEKGILEEESKGLWQYAHNKKLKFKDFKVIGYAYVPPTPFLFKDWERYDVSRYVDPGCIAPSEGKCSVPVPEDDLKYSTIKEDLDIIAQDEDFKKTIMLFHSPPYQTNLDRAALDGQTIDHAPLDVHIGSVAIKNFIEKYQPLITLHGHVHESTSITGEWKDRIGLTYSFNAAHRGPELSVIKFNPYKPDEAVRVII